MASFQTPPKDTVAHGVSDAVDEMREAAIMWRRLAHLTLWKRVFVRFMHSKGFDAVAILAYTTLMGVVPMLAVMLSLFSVSAFFANFEALVMDQVVRNLMPHSQPMIEFYLVQFSQQAMSLKGPGLVIMFITTLLLLWKIDQKLNGLWEAHSKRKWWVGLLNYLGVSILGPLLLGLSLLSSTTIMAWPWFAQTTPWIEQLVFGIKVLPFVFSLLGFVVLYKFVPVVFVSAKAALIGGVFAAIELELLKGGFALYVTWFPTYDAVYGAFAAIPLFLLWLYLVWFIVIWNGALVATLTHHPADVPVDSTIDTQMSLNSNSISQNRSSHAQ